MSKVRVGLRVIRGPDWQYRKQDGGEGHAGTIVYAPKEGSTDEKVTVMWDVGMERRYRAGQDAKYDLVVIDNAQTEIKHEGFKCWSCKEGPILGMRWTCEEAECHNLHLCTSCYMNNKHDISHGFLRIDTPASKAVPVGCRSSASSRKPVMGIFDGARVNRGPHWKWDNEDGGEGDPGTVLEIQTWAFTCHRGAVRVLWDATKNTTCCRVGAGGCMDVTYYKAAKLADYYFMHLPVVDLVNSGEIIFKNSDKVIVQMTERQFKRLQGRKWNDDMKQCLRETGTIVSLQREGEMVKVQYEDGVCWDVSRQSLTRKHSFSKGDAIRINAEENLVRILQEGHGGWNAGMRQTLGKSGRVVKIEDDGDLQVKVERRSWVYSPVVVTLLHDTDGAELPQLTKSELEMGDRDELQDLRAKVNGFDDSYASLMVNYNNDVNKTSEDEVGVEALIEASRNGQVEKVQEILKDQPDLVNASLRHETALHIAAYEGKEEVVEILLKHGAMVNTTDDDKDTALHFAAFGQAEECMRLLLKEVEDINVQNDKGFTSLHITVGKANLECTKLLIQSGASPSIKDNEGDTPMHHVIIQKKRQSLLVNYLFNSPHADFTVTNRRGFNILQWAALKQAPSAVEAVVKNKIEIIDSKMEAGYTALHICAVNNHVEIAEKLLKAGADIEATDKDEHTPLILAVMQGKAKMVELLLNTGCNVNHQDVEGNTALHHSQKSRQLSDTEARRLDLSMKNDEVGIEIMTMLIQAQAKIGIKNKDGLSPLELCDDESVREYMSRANHMATTRAYPMSERGATLPTHWDAFPDRNHVHIVKLNPTGGGVQQLEYQDVNNRFRKTLAQKQVISVKRIQNKFLWEHYFYTRQRMERYLGVSDINELDLYHGTCPDAVEGIIYNNVDIRLAGERVGTMLGQGAYFAANAKHSDGYADPDQHGHKFMFQFTVLCGKWTHGESKFTRPPQIDPENRQSRLYDCCVDDCSRPSTFCLYDPNQYYPEYLIEYQ